ncbi:hypothetical protein [Halobacterium wangiae]|uniref:hypothetical protein n=1 Tax=Halobacterium wangiae TaxID=2902623 RepID=UPI001E56F4A8|nr:hypothetical protein [Halobacterium wangiae]
MPRADPLPTLDSGVTLLRGGDRGGIAALVVAALDRRDGPARWVDARNHASTYALADAARSHRVLDQVQVARAFTAHQHHALVRQLVADARRPTSLVVAPAVDDCYRDDDLLACEAERLRTASLSTLSALADARDVPVLVTATDDDRVADYADAELSVEETQFGPRFEGEDVETTAYWTRRGWQTTIPYWVDIAGRVAERVAAPEPEVVA